MNETRDYSVISKVVRHCSHFDLGVQLRSSLLAYYPQLVFRHHGEVRRRVHNVDKYYTGGGQLDEFLPHNKTIINHHILLNNL